MSELVIQSGKMKGKRLVLPAKEMVVGRDEDCDLRIASSLVSRKHCLLKNTPEGILVTDLKSQNGTLVNDIPITEPILLREGDSLRIGATIFAVPGSQKSKSGSDPSKGRISEADIADWLTDSNSKYKSGDTAVIGTFPPTSAAPTPLPPTEAPTPAPKPKVLKRQLSVKDEAAQIIKKHWEAVNAKKSAATGGQK